VCDKYIMLNRRCSTASLLQIMQHESDVAANFVKKNSLLAPCNKTVHETMGDFRNTGLMLNEIRLFGPPKANKRQ